MGKETSTWLHIRLLNLVHPHRLYGQTAASPRLAVLGEGVRRGLRSQHGAELPQGSIAAALQSKVHPSKQEEHWLAKSRWVPAPCCMRALPHL